MIGLVKHLREAAEEALMRREGLTFTMPPLDMIALLDAAAGVGLRSLPSIVRDASEDRLEALASRLEDAVDQAERHALALGIMAVSK